jgi:putative addiction module component (TIGR02574 family)
VKNSREIPEEAFFATRLYALARTNGAGTLFCVTQNVARILNEAEQLSVPEREELADRLVESLVRDIPPEIQRAHITEVRRRVAEVASGEVSVVSGEEAMQRVRRLVDSASPLCIAAASPATGNTESPNRRRREPPLRWAG